MIRLIVAGSRSFQDYGTICFHLDNYFRNIRRLDPEVEVEIVCGCAEGVDLLGEQYALEHNLPVRYFPVTKNQWDMYGKSAGPRRNKKMAEYATECICFLDKNSESRGTQSMIREAEKGGLILKVIEV